ncbi:MAG: hypothetical protein KBT33_10930 [Prevotellaceae bacterium]|nr:hypothetical protein [Candidatus Minthosoma equi]
MTTIAITYNEKNEIARKAIEFILSLGHFKVEENITPAKKKTLKAIKDARDGVNITSCNSFEEYLKAVAE